MTLPLPPETNVAAVRLAVADVDSPLGFYRDLLGLRTGDAGDGAVGLSADGGEPWAVVLEPAPGAPARPPDRPGLFHLALVAADRAGLATALRRLVDAGYPLDGAADHLVSEALYLRDPAGNGVELYADRPRSSWRVRDGEIDVGTLPLDLRGLLAAAVEPPAEPRFRLGHVHLQTAGIDRFKAFYVDTLGFAPTATGWPGALFVAAGGYHHHLGANVWHSEGRPVAPPGSLGLVGFDLLVPERPEQVAERLPAARRDGSAFVLEDPDGAIVRVVATAGPDD